MRPYSVQPRDYIFVKGYGFLYFARNVGKDVGKNIIQNLSSKYRQRLLDHAKESATNTLKSDSKNSTSNWWFDCDKIADRIRKISKTSSKDNSESNEKKILRKRFILSELRHKITDDLGLKKQNYWWSKIKGRILFDDIRLV